MHTLGWPLRKSASYGEFGGSFIYPMGDDLVAIGFVAGLEAKDVEFSVHDVLQEFKTHRLVWKILGGGERVAWGAKTITEGGYYSFPRRFNAPGLLLVGEGAGLVNVPRLKGVHYAIESGRLAAEAAFRRTSARGGAEPSGRSRFLRRVAPAEQPVEGAVRSSQHAPGVRQGLLRRRRTCEHDDHDEGASAERALSDAPELRGAADEDRPGRCGIPHRTGSTSSTSSRRSSPPAIAPGTTNRTT